MKKFISFFLVCIFVLSTFTSSFAGNDVQEQELGNVREGETLTFESIDDNPHIGPRMPMGDSRAGALIESWIRRIGEHVYEDRAYRVSEKKVQKKFVKYLSGSWAQSDRYVWSETNSTTMTGASDITLSFRQKIAVKLGLSTSRSTSYSVAVQIPADANKYSKLGFASDFTELVFDHKYYVDTKLTSSGRKTMYTPEKNTYLIVYYQ